MQIISRKDAIAARAGQYFTGKPCKSGHTTYRYTASGTCAACCAIAASAGRGRRHSGIPIPREQIEATTTAKIETVLAMKSEKAAAMKSIVEIKVPIHAPDISTIFETATALCLAAYPCLTRSDVYPSSSPMRGLPLYRVSVPSDQVELVRSIANECWNARGVDAVSIHDALLRKAEAMANDAAPAAPEGWK